MNRMLEFWWLRIKIHGNYYDESFYRVQSYTTIVFYMIFSIFLTAVHDTLTLWSHDHCLEVLTVYVNELRLFWPNTLGRGYFVFLCCASDIPAVGSIFKVFSYDAELSQITSPTCLLAANTHTAIRSRSHSHRKPQPS